MCRRRLLGSLATVAAITVTTSGCGAAGGHRGTHRPVPPGKIAYLSSGPARAKRLMVARLDWSDAHQLVVVPGAISGAAWSPDGSSIAVSFARRSQEDGAFVVDSRGRMSSRFRGTVLQHSWSPTGGRIATASTLDCERGIVPRQLRILIFDRRQRLVREAGLLDPGQERAQSETSAKFVSSIAWSPDGRKLAYVVTDLHCVEARDGFGRSYVGILDVVTGTHALLYRPSTGGWSYLGTPAWSPDGGSVAFAVGCASGGINGEGCDSLVVVSTGRRRRAVVFRRPEVLVDSVAWTRGGQLVFGTAFEPPARAGLGAIDVRARTSRWIVRASRLGAIVDPVFPFFELSPDRAELVTTQTYSSAVVATNILEHRAWQSPHSWHNQRIVAVSPE